MIVFCGHFWSFRNDHFLFLLISKNSSTFAPKFDNNPLPNESQKHADNHLSESSQPRDHLGTISRPFRDHLATIPRPSGII